MVSVKNLNTLPTLYLGMLWPPVCWGWGNSIHMSKSRMKHDEKCFILNWSYVEARSLACALTHQENCSVCSFVTICLIINHIFNIQAPSTFSAAQSGRNKDRAAHVITNVELCTSRQTFASNINTSEWHYSSQEPPDSCYEIGSVCGECLHWRVHRGT